MKSPKLTGEPTNDHGEHSALTPLLGEELSSCQINFSNKLTLITLCISFLAIGIAIAAFFVAYVNWIVRLQYSTNLSGVQYEYQKDTISFVDHCNCSILYCLLRTFYCLR